MTAISSYVNQAQAYVSNTLTNIKKNPRTVATAITSLAAFSLAYIYRDSLSPVVKHNLLPSEMDKYKLETKCSDYNPFCSLINAIKIPLLNSGYLPVWESEAAQSQFKTTIEQSLSEINSQDKKTGNTPLHTAKTKKQVQLIINNPNFNAALVENKKGLNAADFKASSGKTNLLMSIVLHKKFGCEAVNSQGRTPLFSAISNHQYSAAETLLKECSKKIDDYVNIIDLSGNTALQSYLLKRNHYNNGIVDLMLQHGANIEAPNNEGNSALELSKNNKNAFNQLNAYLAKKQQTQESKV